MKSKKILPPIRRIGAALSIVSTARGSLLRVAKKLPTGPKDGAAAKTRSHGKIPLTKKTEKIKPQKRNQRRAFSCMVESTCPLIMALSTLEIVSKRESPKIVKSTENISLFYFVID